MYRKYPTRAGEPQQFDADGHLWDARLTPKTAREMIREVMKSVPQLKANGGLVVACSTEPHADDAGRPIERQRQHGISISDGMTGKYKSITLYPSGMNEHVVLHELAHVGAHDDGPDYHGLLFADWCLALEEYWDEFKQLIYTSNGTLRKYPIFGHGEPAEFDVDGDLVDIKFTPATAREAIAHLMRMVPELRDNGRILVGCYSKQPTEQELARLTVGGDNGEMINRSKELGMDMERIDIGAATLIHKETGRASKMLLFPIGMNMHAIIHEMAHIASKTVHGAEADSHGPRFKEWCCKLENIWRNQRTQAVAA